MMIFLYGAYLASQALLSSLTKSKASRIRLATIISTASLVLAEDETKNMAKFSPKYHQPSQQTLRSRDPIQN